LGQRQLANSVKKTQKKYKGGKQKGRCTADGRGGQWSDERKVEGAHSKKKNETLGPEKKQGILKEHGRERERKVKEGFVHKQYQKFTRGGCGGHPWVAECGGLGKVYSSSWNAERKLKPKEGVAGEIS